MPKTAIPASAIITRAVVLMLGLALFFEQAGALRLLHLDGPGQGMMSVDYWFSMVAPAFFLAALWQASNVFVRIGRGESFGPAMVCGLRDIGACLMLGAFAAIVLQPSLIFLAANGFREMRGVTFNLDVENVTLALIGIVFLLLAREGGKLKSTLDEFV